MKHRANVEGWGREQNAEDPNKYFKGAVQLDKDIEAELGRVRLSAERSALNAVLPEPERQQRLISQLEASNYDPEALDEDLRPALDEVMKVRENPAWQMPQRVYGGAVNVGDTTLARYAMREAGDGMMDVSLNFNDESTDVVRVPKVTRDDVKAEFAKRRQAVETATREAEQMAAGGFLDPLGETVGRTQKEGNLNKARADLAALIDGREAYLQGERVREALKDEKFRGKVGEYAGGTEFLKGAADATINAGALVARLAGRDDWMKELAAGQEALDTALPGSTRRALEGGVVNESVSGAQRALGMMAPMIAGGAATRGLTAAVGAEAQLARQAAGRLGVAGAGMSAAATGGAYLDTQREIDAAEAAGNTARADRIRMGRDVHALLTGAVEGAIERLGAAQAFNVGRGARGLLRSLGSEGVEEPLTGLVQRGVIDPLTIDRQQNITDPLATEALTGIMAAGPLVGGGAVMNRLTGQGRAGPGAAPVQGPAAPGAAPVSPAGASVTPLVGIAQRAGQVDLAVASGVDSGLTDMGTVEGDLLSDARFRPPPGAVAPGPQAVPNVVDQSGLADLGTVEGDLLAQVPPRAADAPADVRVESGATPRQAHEMTPEEVVQGAIQADIQRARARLDQATAQGDGRLQRLAEADMGTARSGTGVQARQQRQAYDAAVSAAIEQGLPVNAEAMELWARQMRNEIDAQGNIMSRGLPDGYVKRGDVYELNNEAGQQQQTLAEAAIEQESQQRGIQVPRAGGVSRRGSALPFEEVVGLAAAAIRAGVTQFSTWAAAMVKRFGEAVRQYLRGAWDAATAAANRAARAPLTFGQTGVQRGARSGQAGALLPSNALLNRGGSMVFHRRGKPFRVNALGTRQMLTGSPLPSELVPLLARTTNETKALDQTAAQLARDLQTSINDAAARLGSTPEIMTQRVEGMMNGQAGAGAVLLALDPTLHERARRARNFLDELSVEVSRTLPVGPLRTTLAGNLGSWMRRSYAAFDGASGWNFDSLLKAAQAGRDIAGQPALRIMKEAAAFLMKQNGLPATEVDAKGLPREGTELESQMRLLMDRGTWMATLTGSPGAAVRKDVTSLMKRKDIPEELRRLMGEETNPVHRFLRSASFQAQFIARHHGQVAMRNAGLASGLFSANQGGVYTVQIPADDAPRWSGLGGTWTTPQLWEALQNAAGVTTDGTNLGGKLVETIKALGNEAKLNRVALNPDSWMVNILGNFFSLVGNGDVFSASIIRRLTESASLVRSGRAKPGAVRSAAQEAIQDGLRDMVARLTAQGVLGSSITAADIEASLPRHLLQWVAVDQRVNRGLGAVKGAVIGQGLGRALGATGRVVGGVVGSVAGALIGAQNIQRAQQTVADYVMTGPDALARTAGFLTNYETALASGMTPDAAMEWATTRTLNTFPNYAALPGMMRELSRLGLLGSFIAFQYEVYRNTIWNARHMLEEVSSGNPAMVQRGLQRLAGLGAVGALAGGGLAALLSGSGAAGEDDEERAKMFAKWFAAPWEKDAVLAFSKFDDDGVSYINTSYLLPQNTMMELVTAARNGEDPAEAASRVAGRLYEQFVGSSVHLGPILAAAMNQNRAGTPLTYRTGLAGLGDRLDQPLETILEPGFSQKLERLVYALRGAEKKGRKYSVEEETKRLLGVRQVTRKWDELATNAYRKLSKEYADVRSQANRELGLNRPGAKVRAIDDANAKIAKLRADLAQYEKDATKLGVPVPTLTRAKREASVNLFRDVGLGHDGRVVSLGTRGR
jgi:hypothetical protein